MFCGFFVIIYFPINVTVCSFENPLHFMHWKITTIKFCRINSKGFFFGGFSSVSAYSTTSRSAPHQTAVLVSATSGCCFGQHPFTSLQPFPLPYIYASYDCNSWATHHVCIMTCCLSYVHYLTKKTFIYRSF